MVVTFKVVSLSMYTLSYMCLLLLRITLPIIFSKALDILQLSFLRHWQRIPFNKGLKGFKVAHGRSDE